MSDLNKGERRGWQTSVQIWDKLKELAREKRHEQTAAEKVLWDQLRNRQLNGLKFRRQFPIERFIVDFYCSELRLVIEVDGDYHQYTKEDDEVRQEFLNTQNIEVIRFTNDDVVNNIGQVLKKIVSQTPGSGNDLPLSVNGEGVGG